MTAHPQDPPTHNNPVLITGRIGTDGRDHEIMAYWLDGEWVGDQGEQIISVSAWRELPEEPAPT